MWVCLCEAVTSGEIVEAIDAGAKTVKAVGRATRAGTSCGKCAPTVRILIREHGGTSPGRERGWSWKAMRKL